MPALSIIIVNYNTLALTRACLHSIFEGSQATSFEVLVIDNASAEANIESLKEEFPVIQLSRNSTNAGFAGAVNQGIEMAAGDICLLLNSDTIVRHSAIDVCYNYLVQHKGIGIVSCKLTYPDGVVQHNCQKFPNIRSELILLFRLQKWLMREAAPNLLLGSFFDHRKRIHPDWVWGTFFMFRKEILVNQKNLDNRYFMYGEDMLWCYQARKNQFKTAYLPEAAVIHMAGSSNMENRSQVKRAHEMHFIKTNYNLFYAFFLIVLRTLNYASLGFRDKRYFGLMRNTITLFLTPSQKLLFQNSLS